MRSHQSGLPRNMAVLVAYGQDERDLMDDRDQARVTASSNHVFISYMREDSERVDRLERQLEAAGLPVWRDVRNLWPGDLWKRRLGDAIGADALAFVACFSRATELRARSVMFEELHLAAEEYRLRNPSQPWIFPVFFDDVEPPAIDLGASQTLNDLQWARLFDDWNQESDRLIEALRSRVQPRPRALGTKEPVDSPGNRSEHLSLIIDDLGLSISEVSSIFGVSRQAVTKWKQGGVPQSRATDLAYLVDAARFLSAHRGVKHARDYFFQPITSLGGRSMMQLAKEGAYESVLQHAQTLLLRGDLESFVWRSEHIRAHEHVGLKYGEVMGKCQVIFSSPGTFFFAGEKSIVPGATATCMKVPRRVYVGLTEDNSGSSNDLPLLFGSSQVLDQNDESQPKAWLKAHYPEDHPRTTAALYAAAASYECLTEAKPAYQPLRGQWKVHILSEWQGEYGVGWSGAFASALSAAVTAAANPTKLGELERNRPGTTHELWRILDSELLMRHGWCIEAILHGRRASGSAVAGSMLPGGLPFTYSVPGVADQPNLVPSLGPPPPAKTDLTSEHDYWRRLTEYERSLLNDARRPETFSPFLLAGTPSIFHLVEERMEAQILEEFVAHNLWLAAVHTGVSKNTAEAAGKEHLLKAKDRALWQSTIDGLKDSCEKMQVAVGQAMTELGLSGTRAGTIDAWMRVAVLMPRINTLISTLVGDFPLGNQIAAAFQQAARGVGGTAGTKITGAGGGGTLIAAAHADPMGLPEILRVPTTLREHSGNHVYTLYDMGRDGVETQGLRYHSPDEF